MLESFGLGGLALKVLGCGFGGSGFKARGLGFWFKVLNLHRCSSTQLLFLNCSDTSDGAPTNHFERARSIPVSAVCHGSVSTC